MDTAEWSGSNLEGHLASHPRSFLARGGDWQRPLCDDALRYTVKTNLGARVGGNTQSGAVDLGRNRDSGANSLPGRPGKRCLVVYTIISPT